MAINHRMKKSKASSSSSKEHQHSSSSDELYQVEKIIDDKLDKDGVTILYKTRWKGYAAADDTWEPTENVASTGHVDRYLRLKRQKTLNAKTPGVAIIEYEDGETEMVNLQIETFRNYQEDDELKQRDDNNDDESNRQINNFDLIIKGETIEILWPLADMYFPCKIIAYTKLMSGSKKRSRKAVDNDNFKEDDDIKMKSMPEQKKHRVDKMKGTAQQQLKSLDGEEQMNSISDESLDNYDSDRLVERVTHEPEDDSSDDDNSDDSVSEDHAGSNKLPDPVLHGGNNQARKLTFEEQWRLKLQRTQEMMNRECLDKSQMSSLMARQL